MQPIVTIEAYNLADFCVKAQAAVLDGYVFDLESNANYPQSFGSYYSVNMIRPTEVDIEVESEADEVEVQSEVETESQPKKARAKKVK